MSAEGETLDRSGKTERKTNAGSDSVEAVWQDLPEAVKYGDVCYQTERYADALEAYSGVLESPAHRRLPAEIRARLHYRIACCYQRRRNYRLSLEHLDQARRILPRHLDKIRLAKIYARRGDIVLQMGQYERSERYLGWAKKLLSGTNEHEELALIEMSLGVAAARRGQTREARRNFLNALTTFRRIKDRTGEARALNNLGIQCKNACEWREAVRYLEEARGLLQRLGVRQRLIPNYLNLGIVHWKMGKWELSEEYLATGERIARETEDLHAITCIQLAQGNLALRRRNWDEARRLYEEAHRVALANDYAREAILAQEFLGELELDRGEVEKASELLEANLADAKKMAPTGDLVREIARRLGEVRLAQDRAPEALLLAKEAAAESSREGDRYEEAVALRVVGLAMMRTGEVEQGQRVLEMALGSLSEIGESYQKGLTHLFYARFLGERAVQDHSNVLLERAAVQYQRAYGAFLDLDARVRAATAAYERAVLECKFNRFEEAATYRNKARQVFPTGADDELEVKLVRLGEELEDAFAERWSAGGDALTSLREMKRLFQGATDTDAVLQELIRLAVTRSGSNHGLVAHAADEGGVEVVATYGWEPNQARALLGDLGPGLSVALESRPLWSSNTSQDDRFRALAENHNIQSFVLLPLSLSDSRSGVLYVGKTHDNFEGAYHQGEVQLLTLLANLAALSIMERWNTRLARENEALRRALGPEAGEDRFVTENQDLQRTLSLVAKVANSPVSILIEGETGTGKGLLSQIIHEASDRREKPFVQINCAALPEQLLESELFGHVKGSFTGASYNKVGLFKEAESGTLFLDEVDKTSLSVQAKLLHVLDSKEVRPVGAVKSYRVDTRVICATNTNLLERIKAGAFLEDLYYRLNDFVVTVPPLRDRREDIPLLIDYFVKKFSAQYGRPEVKLTPDVRRLFLELPWRGNVRELEKTIRRLVVLADEDLPVGPELLPPELQAVEPSGVLPAGTTLRDEVARTERRVIAEALRANKWNKAKVARTLKVSYPCLLKKIKEHGLAPPAAR